MKNLIREIIKESVEKFFENKSIWDKHGNNLPKVFKSTIYRLPSREELKEVDSFNLSSNDILSGFKYTIVGRGMMDDKNRNMIINSIKMLCELNPNNKEYKKALSDAMQIKSRFQRLK